MIPAQVRSALRELAIRISSVFSRGELTNDDESSRMRTLQASLLAGELRDGIEHFEPYGFTSRPHPGAEPVVVFPGGVRDHGIAVVVADRRYRLQGLAHGEVAIATDEGDRIHLKRNGQIEVHAGNLVRIVAPDVRIEGDLEVTGEVKDRTDTDGSTMEEIRNTYNGHVHPENGGSGPTDPPTQQMP